MAKSVSRFELGEHVTFINTVAKERTKHGVEWRVAGLPTRESHRLDVERRWYLHTRQFTEGVIVGARTLSEYAVSYETDGGEYGTSYGSYTVIGCIPGTGKRAWLVSYDMRRKPVLVLDEHVEKKEN